MTISIVAAFLFLAAAVSLLTGVSLLTPGRVLDQLWKLNPQAYAAFSEYRTMSGSLLLALACIAGAGACGLLKGSKWGWWIAVILFAVNGCGDVTGFFTTHDWIRSGAGVVVAAAFLYVLTLKTSRAFFEPHPS